MHRGTIEARFDGRLERCERAGVVLSLEGRAALIEELLCVGRLGQRENG
jgi:hypothetical protein